MKTKLLGLIAIAIIATTIIALPLAGCKDEPEQQEQPQKQPDTPRALTFGGSVTIKSDDQFTPTEWKTLCDKVVTAIERGCGAAFEFMRPGIATYFTENTISAVLIKSATYDVETKSGTPSPNTMYFKANGSAIDGLSGDNMLSAIGAMRGGNSFPTP